jgi:hypothetical protein
MKLTATNQIELSYANALALVKAYEERQRGIESAYPLIYKVIDGQTVAVSVASNEEHYSESELADRKSPYLPPEAWAGVL